MTENEGTLEGHPRAPDARGSQLAWGVGLMVLGAAFLANNLDLWDFNLRDMGRYWPVLLLVMGFAQLLGPRREDGRRGGAWLIFVGMLGLAHTTGVIRFRQSWPLFLVAAGVSMAIESLRNPQPPAGDPHGD